MLSFLKSDDIVIVSVIGAIAGSWYLLKYQVNKVLDNQKLLFSKFEAIKDKLLADEMNAVNYLKIKDAENKFVTKEEIKVIEKDISKLDNEVNKILDILIKDKQ